MKTAFICSGTHNYSYVYPETVTEYLKSNAGFDGAVYNKSEVLENPSKFADTEYIFSTWGMPQFTEEEISAVFPSLKCVFYSAGTVQAFARPFLKKGIKVFSAWAANAVPVAEYTVAQIILANTGYFHTARLASIGKYADAKKDAARFIGNYDAKVGIIGVGMIGKLVINMLKAYRLDVLVFDPFLPDEKALELGVRKTTLDEIFECCNVISNHLANNEQTKGILNGKLFMKMLPYSTFLNTGRGAQVVEADLIELLSSRPDITAVLDVTYPEPPIEGSPLYTLENCVLTPHIAGSLGNEVHRMAEYMLCEYKSYVSGELTRYEITEKMLETMA